jgi:membrane-bound ClpP family serine protease
MKKLLLLLLFLSFYANSETEIATIPTPITSYNKPPIVPVTVDSQVQQMSRNDVIMASQECETGGMRAVVVTTKRLVAGMLTDIIIDVQCMPRFKIFP